VRDLKCTCGPIYRNGTVKPWLWLTGGDLSLLLLCFLTASAMNERCLLFDSQLFRGFHFSLSSMSSTFVYVDSQACLSPASCSFSTCVLHLILFASTFFFSKFLFLIRFFSLPLWFVLAARTQTPALLLYKRRSSVLLKAARKTL